LLRRKVCLSIGDSIPGAANSCEITRISAPAAIIPWQQIGVVHANQTVPFTVNASGSHLDLQPGGQTNLILSASSVQSPGNGTYVYSWPSYTPEDVNVTFSPRSTLLIDLANNPSQAKITASPRTTPRQNILGLELDTGTVRAWAMVKTEVTGQAPVTFSLPNTAWFMIGATAVVLVLVLVTGRHLQRSNRKTAVRP